MKFQSSGIAVTFLGLAVVGSLIFESAEGSTAQNAGQEAGIRIEHHDRSDSSSLLNSLDPLVITPYDAVKRGEREIGINEVLLEYGRSISKAIPVRDHYFVVGDRGIEIPMFVSNPTKFLNFVGDKYVPNFTLENIVIVDGHELCGVDLSMLDGDSPEYDPLEEKSVRDALLRSSDLDVILPYYDMSVDEFLSEEIRYFSVDIDVSGLMGSDMTDARLRAITKYDFEAKKIASLELIADAKSDAHYSPKAYFWYPVSCDTETLTVELLVGVIDLKIPEYANY